MKNFVEKIIVDASFEMTQEKGYALRPMFHDIIRSHFPDAIDEVLTSKSKRQYKKYEKIYLNLGEISLENFRNKIIDALKSKLKEIFIYQENAAIEPYQMLLNILMPFLKEGNLESNAETIWKNYQYIFEENIQNLTIKKLSIQNVIEEFIRNHSEKFDIFLKENISNETIIHRLIAHIQEYTLMEMVSIQIQELVHFLKIFYKIKIESQISENALKFKIWQNILNNFYQRGASKTRKGSLSNLILNIIGSFSFEQKSSIRQIIFSREISVSQNLRKEILGALGKNLSEFILPKYYDRSYVSGETFLQDFTKLLTKQEYIFIQKFTNQVIPPFNIRIIQKSILTYFLGEDFFEQPITESVISQNKFIKNIIQHSLAESGIESFLENMEFLKKSSNFSIAQVSEDIYKQTIEKNQKYREESSLKLNHQQKAFEALKELINLESPSVIAERIVLDSLIQLLSMGAISPAELILLENGNFNFRKVIEEVLAKKKILLREKLLSITQTPTKLSLLQLKEYLTDDLIAILLKGIGKSLQKISKSRFIELQKQYKTAKYLFEEIVFLIQSKVAKKDIEEKLLFAYQNYEKESVRFIQDLSNEQFEVLSAYRIDFIQHLLQEDIRFIEQDTDLQFFYLIYFIKNKKLPEDIILKIQKTESFIGKILSYLAENQAEKLRMVLGNFVSKELSNLRKIAPKIIKQFYKKLTREELVQKALEQRIKEKNTSYKTPSESQESRDLSRQNREIYIENPGLVLVHPFINTLFRRLGYLDKKSFIDKSIQHRAVYLLQYIVESNGEPKEEHQMILNKLLCGVPLKEPLLTDIVLSETEKETCESLLEGVIANWQTLKNIKPTNFRASFMKREAKLVDKFDFWELKVEPTGIDVLLETLPWSIKIIVFPWMEKSINVDWV